MGLLALVIASLMAAAVAMQGAGAVQYVAINNATGTPGGVRFDKEIGLLYSRQVLSSAASFIWATFKQSENERKGVGRVTLIVDNIDGVAYTIGNETHLSAGYVAGFQGDVRTEVEGVLFHESTHVWQWDGKGTANSGLIEGIADYVRLKAGLAPAGWIKPGEGDRWDAGYAVTARFLDYCNGLGKGSFVADLNRKMKDGYSDAFFLQLLGKTVNQLWSDYKALYGY